ncbi:hypothetical protein [Sandaracinus amylolyticus]|uniref:hypothetical protein n=1 Tax=Sandaracinus amylolyticus TaxID=927083 RepID=UPI00146FDF4C|nr:hypothetical protein [Sandaracinus amylolyticus]
MQHLLLHLLVASLFLTACGNEAGAGDPTTDAGPAVDAATFDAAVVDASSPDDDDAGTPAEDAGQPIDADVPDCRGNAVTCYGRDVPACEIGIGCVVIPRCLGVPARCFEQPTPDDCSAVAGCTWNDGLGRCGGAQRQCATFDEDTCETQPGCFYGGVCGGQITRCALLDEQTCDTQIGCTWDPS